MFFYILWICIKSSGYRLSLKTMENCDKTFENTKLPAKYEKFIVFSYWLSEKMKTDETNDFAKMTNIFSNVNDQMEFIDGFFEDYKIVQKTYKKGLRERAKESKPKPPPKEPKEQKKRGRKKKEVVDNRTEEEKLMDEILAKAQEE